MNTFDDVLREVSEQMDLPLDVRRRVLLELAADLEDLRRSGVESGLDDAAARARALEFVDYDPQAVSALAAVHAAAPRRFLEGLSGVARSRGERVVLLLVSLALVQVGGTLCVGGEFVQCAGALAWPVLFVLLATVLAALLGFYRQRVRGDQRAVAARATWTWLTRSMLLQAALGLIAMGIGLSEALAALGEHATDAEVTKSVGDIPEGLLAQLRILRKTTAALALASFGLLVACLLWHRSAQRLHTFEHGELELLRSLAVEGFPTGTTPSTPHSTQLPCSN